MKTHHSFRIEIETPTKRESILRAALEQLPESNPDKLLGSLPEAFDRLLAAEIAKRDAEHSVRILSAELRAKVAALYSSAEITSETSDLLNVW